MPSNNKRLVKAYERFCKEYRIAVEERGWITGQTFEEGGIYRSPGYVTDVEGVLLALLRYVCLANI